MKEIDMKISKPEEQKKKEKGGKSFKERDEYTPQSATSSIF